MRTTVPTMKPEVDGEPGPTAHVIVCTEIALSLRAVIGPTAYVRVGSVEVVVAVVSPSSFVDFLVCRGTSAIATRAPAAQAIFTRSPAAKSERDGDEEVRLQVRRWWRFLTTLMWVGVIFAMTPTAEASAWWIVVKASAESRPSVASPSSERAGG
jgi:hypothetical protein